MILAKMDNLYYDLQMIGAKVDAIKKYNPTEKQVQELLDGLRKLQINAS
jgi:hypothetical protein